jgi:hypothetical protein
MPVLLENIYPFMKSSDHTNKLKPVTDAKEVAMEAL